MNRYGATARDRHATTVVSLLLTLLVVITLTVIAAQIVGSVRDALPTQTGQVR